MISAKSSNQTIITAATANGVGIAAAGDCVIAVEAINNKISSHQSDLTEVQDVTIPAPQQPHLANTSRCFYALNAIAGREAA